VKSRAVFKSLLLLIGTMGLLTAFDGCNSQPGAAPATKPETQPSPLGTLRQSAKAIVSDPSNWKQNTREIADFYDAANALAWKDKPEVIEFESSVQAIVTFSTSWNQTVDEEVTAHLKDRLSNMVANVEAHIQEQPLPDIANVTKDDSETERDASVIAARTIKQLRDDQAAEFGKHYARLLKAYQGLYEIVQAPDR
jgi:hypothetical protein